MQLPESWPAPASTKALASQKVLEFLRPSETWFIKNNPSNSRNNMQSHIKNKKNGSISS